MYNIATAFPLPRSFDKEIVTEDSGFGSAAIMISPEAEKLRQQGNELYQSKNVPEAIKCYNEAAILAPKDPSPYSNLSAAHYEMGLYTQCISDIRTALQLAGTESSSLEKKLALRLAKAQLQTYDYQVAANTLAQMTKGQDKTVLGSICQRYIEYSQVDKEVYRREQLSQLPKYLCALGETKEYYVVGHDEACSQMDSNMFGSSERFISIFFAGIGDARNLYATLLKIDQLEQEDSAIPSRKYHLTINDIKAEALARDVLVLFLLTEFDSIDVSKETERTEALTTLFFLYIAPVVPQRIAELIQAAIDRLIDSLVPEKTIAEYLHIYSDDIGPLVEALRSWRGQLRSKYSVAEALQMHLNHCKSSFPAYSEHVERSVEPNIWEPERTLFAQTGVCRPPESWVQEFEPILAGIRSNKKHVKKIKAYVADKWTMNVTMLDSRWQGSLNDTLGAVLSFDPFGVADNLYLHTGLEKPQQKPYLYNYVARFFAHVATAIGRLRKRLVVEIMYGEVSDILETIRYNGSDRPETFPAKYDRVHLSNIPDYIGGILSSTLFAMPILKDNLTSTMTSCCLSNTPAWKNIVAYYTEYLLVNDATTIRKLLRIEEFPEGSDDAGIQQLRAHLCSVPTHIRKNLAFEELEPFGIDKTILGMSTASLRKLDLRTIVKRNTEQYIGDYTQWSRSSPSTLEYKSLLPRVSLQRWLFALFFKIVLPVDRLSSQSLSFRIHSPLNLTTFFRVLTHLQETGYPAHWLSEVVEQLIENRVTTSARPPQTSPLTLAEAEKEMPLKKLSTAPFSIETAILTVLFGPMLPFPVLTASLPEPSSIYSNQISLFPITVPEPDLPVYILLILHKKMLKAATGCNVTPIPPFHNDFRNRSIRHGLHPEFEHRLEGAKLNDYRTLQDKGIVMITTFKWHHVIGAATFWMRADVMDEMRASDEWCIGMWRTDNWKSVTMLWPVDTEKVVKG